MSKDAPVVTTCGWFDCKNTIQLTQRQMRRYRAAVAKGKTAETPFFCSRVCRARFCASPFPKISWHCNNQDCHKEFKLNTLQAKRCRDNGVKEFYCSQKCAWSRAITPGLPRSSNKFTEAGLDAYWAKVVDPTYYAGIRHGYATPLSFRDKGIPMARSTGARS